MDLVKAALAYVVARLTEASTWSGIAILFATHFGVTFNPDVLGGLAQAGTTLAALLAIIIKDGGIFRSSPVAKP